VPKYSHRYLLFALVVVGVLLGATYQFAYKFYFGLLTEHTSARALLYRNALVSGLERFQHLPYVLSRDPEYARALEYLPNERLNDNLKDFAESAGVEAIYLMNASGLTIASSNALETPTFLGQNYAFRPYFVDAMNSRKGEFFAIGATTSRPGYFISQGIVSSTGDVLGVLVVKVDLEPLVQGWNARSENIFVTDQNGVVVLASDSSWQYKTLTQLDQNLLARIDLEKQFGTEPLLPLKIQFENDSILRLNEVDYISSIQEIGRLDWKLHYLTASQSAIKDARNTVLLIAMPIILLLMAYFALSSRRVRNLLEQSKRTQNSLYQTNLKLEQEIEERKITEKQLEKAQTNLREASKLAALGQLSASVAHELGQPIAALQNYVASAELPGSDLGVDGTHLVDKVGGVSKRIRHITKQLRFFAQPGEDKFSILDLSDLVRRVDQLKLIDFELSGVKFTFEQADQSMLVNGDKIRLEQVLVNLLRNAIDATKTVESPNVIVRLSQDGHHCNLQVLDNGPGISTDNQKKLLEPFFTTKASGDGMGLGLSISNAIMNEHDGKLILGNNPDGGACICMQLPMVD